MTILTILTILTIERTGSRGRFPRAETPDAVQRLLRDRLPAGGAGAGGDSVRDRGAPARRRVRGEGGNGVRVHHLLRAHVLRFRVRLVKFSSSFFIYVLYLFNKLTLKKFVKISSCKPAGL